MQLSLSFGVHMHNLRSVSESHKHPVFGLCCQKRKCLGKQTCVLSFLQLSVLPEVCAPKVWKTEHAGHNSRQRILTRLVTWNSSNLQQFLDQKNRTCIGVQELFFKKVLIWLLCREWSLHTQQPKTRTIVLRKKKAAWLFHFLFPSHTPVFRFL